jgi:hypothetical protein
MTIIYYCASRLRFGTLLGTSPCRTGTDPQQCEPMRCPNCPQQRGGWLRGLAPRG